VVFVDLVGDVVDAAIATERVDLARASSLKTAPLRLFGVTVTIARVRSVIAARSASSRG
jgi:hypothetical protein